MQTADEDSELPAEYLTELGRIVVAWNRLESQIMHTLVLAMIEDYDDYDRALVVFTHMAFQQKLDALSAMLRIIEPEFADLYRDEVQGVLKKAQESRNAAMHQYWYAKDGKVIRANLKARGVLQLTHQPVTLQDLIAVSVSLTKAVDKLAAAISLPLALEFTRGSKNTK